MSFKKYLSVLTFMKTSQTGNDKANVLISISSMIQDCDSNVVGGAGSEHLGHPDWRGRGQ